MLMMTPIEEKIDKILQRIKKFYDIEIEFHHKITDGETYTKHHCHKSSCFYGGRFLHECDCEDRCNCCDTITYVWTKYELDFLVTYKKRHFCIECDGREFHTGQYEKYDKQRDDYLLKRCKTPTLRLEGKFIHYGTDKAIFSRITKFVFGVDKSNEILKIEAEPAKRLSI